MAAAAAFLQSVSGMTGRRGGLITVMTGKAELIPWLTQKSRLCGQMWIMAGYAALLQRDMDKGLAEGGPVMAAQTIFIAQLGEQLRVGTVMGQMTVTALPLSHGPMQPNRPAGLELLTMALLAELRLLGAQVAAANNTVGQMTALAIIARHRAMDVALLKLTGHVGMTILAPLAPGGRALFGGAGEQQKKSCQAEYESCFVGHRLLNQCVLTWAHC